MTEQVFDSFDEGSEYKSKTQLKQEMLALQEMGKQLVDLSEANLNAIPLPDDLAEAVALARRINRKKDGFRRQLQFIGKLMRSIDVEPIQLALGKIQQSHHHANQAFHKLEQLRERILHGKDDALEVVLAEYPQLDRQKLRQLKRQALKQAAENKPPKAAREIFQYLKQEISE